MSRREVVTAAAVALLGAACAPLAPRSPHARASALAVVVGDDPFAATRRAVDALGGIARFVGRGSRVLVNANTAALLPGSIVRPEVTLAVVHLCLEAGAAEISALLPPPSGYWQRSGTSAQLIEPTRVVRPAPRAVGVVALPGAALLRQAHVIRSVLDADVVLNLSIAKHHQGTGFSGALKNIMGATAFEPTNRFCHTRGVGNRTDPAHLSRCIADLNLIRRADLNLVDATEFLTTNGPEGPGVLGHARAVLAATDPVAADAYATRFLGLSPSEVAMIGHAADLDLGEADLGRVEVVELRP